MTLANTWLRLLRARVPPLALALDDSLLSLLERGRALAPPPDPDLSPNPDPRSEGSLAAGMDARAPPLGAGPASAALAGSVRGVGPGGAAGFPARLHSRAGLLPTLEASSTGIAGGPSGDGAGDMGVSASNMSGGPGNAACVTSDAVATAAEVAAAAAVAAIAAEAAEAAAVRLWVDVLELGPLQLLLDVHVSGGSAVLPIALDTNRCVPDHMMSVQRVFRAETEQAHKLTASCLCCRFACMRAWTALLIVVVLCVPPRYQHDGYASQVLLRCLVLAHSASPAGVRRR